MKCPNCGSQTKYHYIQRRPKTKTKESGKFVRTNFSTKCSKCGYTENIEPKVELKEKVEENEEAEV